MSVLNQTPTSPGTATNPAGAPFQADERRRFFDFQRQVRGLLAIVRSMVRRMAESTGSVEEFAAHLEGRLGALARIQGFLLRAPDAPVDLEELIRGEFLAQSIGDEHFEIRGPRVLLSAKEAATVGLALHELATNSIKFGALANPEGRLQIQWARCGQSPESVKLEWREQAGSIISATTHRGFGFELIEQTLPYQLGGTSALVLAPSGLQCSITFALPPPD